MEQTIAHQNKAQAARLTAAQQHDDGLLQYLYSMPQAE